MVKVGRKETMTVAELREFINRFPQDMPVMATWEGVMASLKPENFGTEVNNGVEVVYVDVEDYYS